MQGNSVQVDFAMLVDMKITTSSWTPNRDYVCHLSGHNRDDVFHRTCPAADDGLVSLARMSVLRSTTPTMVSVIVAAIVMMMSVILATMTTMMSLSSDPLSRR